MNTIFGNFDENLPPSQEYLVLSFSPSSISLQQRWRNNGLSADFLADYLSTFFPSVDEEELNYLDKRAEIKSAVSYIANELLENAMKYTSDRSSSPISIQLYLNPDKIIFQVTNSVHADTAKKLQTHIEELTNSDPEELYLRQLEESAAAENSEISGLGFLTMVNDYGARLGWKFETLPQEIAITTMVELQI
jgi:hypothetical protein